MRKETVRRKILPLVSGSDSGLCFSRSEVDCNDGFVDLLRIPLAKGIPWAVPHQQVRLLSCPTCVKMRRESGRTSFCIAPFVSLPVLPLGRN